MLNYTKLEAIYDCIPAAIDRKIEAVISKYEAPQIETSKVTNTMQMLAAQGRLLSGRGAWYSGLEMHRLAGLAGGCQQQRYHDYHMQMQGRGPTGSIFEGLFGTRLF